MRAALLLAMATSALPIVALATDKPAMQMPEATREGAPPANYDENQVRPYTLPDPLVTTDGRRIATVEQWERERRPEIMRLLERYQFGTTPGWRQPMHIEWTERDARALGGLAKRSQLRIAFGKGAPVIHVLIHRPASATDAVPAILSLGFSPNSLLYDEPGIDVGPGWNVETKSRIPARDARKLVDFDARPFLAAGIATVNVYYGDIDPDFLGGTPYGVRSLFGTANERAADEWGTMGGWAWGLSRVMDALETAPGIDDERVALTGVSRLGKAVLWAGAQDPRFAILLPVVSGEGGAALSRRNYGETIADLMNPTRYPYWYAPRYDEFSFNVDALPVDGHLLVAMAAPRPIMLLTGSLDGWSDPRGEWLSAQAAAPVYQLYGLETLSGRGMPKAEEALLSDMGWFMHDGIHGVFPSDRAAMIAFMQKHFDMEAR